MINAPVLITGLGMFSSLGETAQQTFSTAELGRSAIVRARDEIHKWLPHALEAPCQRQFQPFLKHNESGLDRTTQLSMIGAPSNGRFRISNSNA